MVNVQERESRGKINPYINFFKFLNTSVQCLKKGHKEISVLNPLCSRSALLVNKGKTPYYGLGCDWFQIKG